MSGQPKPKVALDNECSVVYNNTLYTYQSDAFQSLELVSGAEWKLLDQGEALSGAACVNANSTDTSQAALWIVGGTGGSADYKGLQKYTYSTGTWESITPVTAVTENRTDHAAAYLPGWNAIVVYAGNQDGSSGLSTQTFSISLSEPYSVLAYESDGAPPATSPILLQWSDTQAVMVGGASDNTQIMLFEVGSGWTNSGATLASPLKTGTDGWHASLVTGSDGSKSLYTYDMTVSPNVANRTLVVDAHGAPVSDAVAITRRWDESTQPDRRNTLTATSWPSYNDTYASSAIRTNSAAAEASDGTVVLSGGNMEDVICLFSQTSNSWINATELLASNDQKTLHVSTSSASSPTASATVSSGTSATAAAESTGAVVASSSTSSGGGSSSSSSLSANQVLGVILGSIGGAIVLLLLVYCQIRRRKTRQDFIQAGHARRASGSSGGPEKDGMAVATESFPRSPTNPSFMRGHMAKGSNASFSSMAILMGKGPKGSMDGLPRPSFGRAGADSNKQQLKGQISGPMPAIAGPNPPLRALAPDIRDEKGVSFSADTVEPAATLRVPANQQDALRRSSGWNRYWSGESGALNILGYGNNNANRNTVASEGSRYSTNGPAVSLHNRRTQDSATVPPLHVEGPPRFGRVNSGSPTTSNYPSGLSGGMAGQIGNRPPSQESDLSGYSSGIPASVHDSWDPTALTSRPFTGTRATSSMYSSAFPMPPSSPSQRPPMPRNPQSGISQQPQLATAHTSDMSWLNLGVGDNRNRY
ncbi:hypothetical protein M406DRAFT_292158 [Cryphonectria parasitica EP155]|uniref:Pre-mRNA splicing factor CLF1 n=1 Tax=Cryphonectria parasitica (strain ATCC 38755 / EP155) TaxID=660469 RepID=A0A9P4Y1L2_CRYP1|nr:uncharacterized protein M406DRAFT_292158 [Cryphonectria parasitica EP155]KAF3764926.1 hypothetical protein M406DRAFT_292158 [Cryphonectria parasitica EP155]